MTTRGGRIVGQRKRCLRCHQRGVMNANKLCEACKAAGWRWCSHGHHVVTARALKSVRHGCHACVNAKRTEIYRMRKRLKREPVPDGYVLINEAARLIFLSPTCIRVRIYRGHVKAWRRGPRSPWYIDPRSIDPRSIDQ